MVAEEKFWKKQRSRDEVVQTTTTTLKNPFFVSTPPLAAETEPLEQNQPVDRKEARLTPNPELNPSLDRALEGLKQDLIFLVL